MPTLTPSNQPPAVSPQAKADLLADSLSSNFAQPDHFGLPAYVSEPVPDSATCTTWFVSRFLRKLPEKSAVGLDGIRAPFLKGLAFILAKPITTLLNRCMFEGSIPVVWKAARVTPIPKEPGATDPNKFRPISILPILGKLAESWLRHCLSPYLKTSSRQFAFRSGASTEDAIALVQSLVAQGFQACHPAVSKVALISLDVTKAFDQVSHRLLLQCLEARGVPRFLLRVVSSYLEGRSQQVIVEGAASANSAIPSGVPQGGLLSPSLFIAFIDSVLTSSLPPTANPMQRILFADDFIGVKTLKSDTDEHDLQRELDAVVGFLRNIGLSVNASKSSILICSLASRPQELSTQPAVNGTPIQSVSEMKYLGVWLDRKLSFDKNSTVAASRAKRIIGTLWAQAGRFAENGAFKILCKSKVIPILTYCLPAVTPRYAKDFLLLEKTNRFALRLLLNNFTSPYGELLVRSGCESVASRWFQATSLLMYKYVHGQRSFPISLQINNSRRSARRPPPHSYQIFVPRFSNKSCDQFPIFRAMNVWNCLKSGPWGVMDEIINLPFHRFKAIIQRPELFQTLCAQYPNLIVSTTGL